MTLVRPLVALIDVDAAGSATAAWAAASQLAKTGLARAVEGALRVAAVGVHVAVMRVGRRQSCFKAALVDVGAVRAIAPVPRRRARARVAQGALCSDQVGAGRLLMAEVRAKRAFIYVGAGDPITRVSRRARANKRAGEVGTVVTVEAVVRPFCALVDLRARCGRGTVPTVAAADSICEMRRLHWAAETVTIAWTAARCAGRVARCTGGPAVGKIAGGTRRDANASMKMRGLGRTTRAVTRTSG